MEIVTLNKEYLERILAIFSNYPKHGVGLKFYFRGQCFFIPLTSKIKEEKNSTSYEKSKYFILGKNGTLLINNYVYIDPKFVVRKEENKTVITEHQILQDNKKIIEKKLQLQINITKKSSDEVKKDIFNNYFIFKFNPQKNKEQAVRYMKDALNSMSNLEKITNSYEIINDVIDYKVLEKADSFDLESIFKIKSTWEKIIRDFGTKLTLDYIIEINASLSSHQSLFSGIIRNMEWSVGKEFIIPVPDIEIINKLILNVNEGIEDKESNGLELFYSIILEQWFFDGNKRTAFTILNKILIENGLGIVIFNKENHKIFEDKLYMCYKEKYTNNNIQASKEELFVFLKEKCLIRF